LSSINGAENQETALELIMKEKMKIEDEEKNLIAARISEPEIMQQKVSKLQDTGVKPYAPTRNELRVQ
jgi:hypothetical protein